MRNIIFIALCGHLLTGCFWGDELHTEKKLTKDFWLNWWAEENDQHILLSMQDNGNAGTLVIKNTVFAVGYNNNFIIAKQHPNKEDEVSERLFGDRNSKGDFEIKNLADTIYLSKDDKIYKDSGKWYHISNGWNPPDSLKPYKKITYYHIIDIRQYQRTKWDSYKVYTFDNEGDFKIKRHELNVPDDLNFTITNKTLE